MRRSSLLASGALLALAVLGPALACAGGGDREVASTSTSTSPTTTVAPATAVPEGQDLYTPPDALRDGPAGSLVWYEELDPIGEARAWRTLTRSTGFDGRPTWVTGTVFRPVGPAPDGGFPVAVWAHGTAGSADECAPSRGSVTIPALADLLADGFVVAAPDSAGLGPPGPAQYLVGLSEGRSLLDAARSAALVPGSDAGDDVAVWGYSSGGHGALFAAQEAASYAPDLDLLGTVAVAPVSDMARFAGGSAAFPLTFGYAFLTFGAWAQVYDEDLSGIFGPGALDRLPLLTEQCATLIASYFALTPIEELRAGDPLTTPPWPDLLEENDVGRSPLSGPVLLVQGAEDPIIAPESTGGLARRLCRLDTEVELRMVPDERHDVVLAEADGIARWLDDRAQGRPATTTCDP